MNLSPVNPNHLPPPKKSLALPWIIGGAVCLFLLLGLVGSVALFVFKDDIKKIMPTSLIATDQTPHIRCRGRHGLVKFRPHDNAYRCDVCGRNIPVGTVTYGCRLCNWDKCDECAEGP